MSHPSSQVCLNPAHNACLVPELSQDLGGVLCVQASVTFFFSVGDFSYFTFYRRPVEFEKQGLMMLRHRLLYEHMDLC